DFLRVSCETAVSFGDGTAGALSTIRIGLEDSRDPNSRRRLCQVALDVFDAAGVTAVHLGVHEVGSANQQTAESALRPPTIEPEFDYVMMVEALDRKRLE